MQVQFNGRIPAFQAGYVGSIPITRSNFSKCAFNSAGQSNCLLSSKPLVRVQYGALDMVGVAQLVRASDCGPEGREFETHLPPFKIGCKFRVDSISTLFLLYVHI